jgi:hypothetical protein
MSRRRARIPVLATLLATLLTLAGSLALQDDPLSKHWPRAGVAGPLVAVLLATLALLLAAALTSVSLPLAQWIWH